MTSAYLLRWGNIVVLLAVLASCSKGKTKFRLVPSDESGITFRNTLNETVDFNILNYMYFYNGGGVAVGDLNSDDLPDIYFTGNQVPNKLYLNAGNFKFKDVTDRAGVAGFNGWCTGVTMADVNSDGLLDIYVSYLGDYEIYKGKNQLFINEGTDDKGVPQFRDRALEYGLDLVGFSTQAAFFDYDRDGDLDMYMLNHSLHQNGTFGNSALRRKTHPLAGDKLLRNDNGHFVDVSSDAGIFSSVIGYGLGIVISDVNMDGWPDIYVGNDFHENDYLYINQGNGTFKELLEAQLNHTSRYTMGVDCADFNNDGFPDLLTMDMLPEDPLILKSSAAEEAFDIYNFKIQYGYNHQFSRNNLQLNNQDGTFSEIGIFAGVHATDWSWSGLFADFNLDGNKDIFVSNGILRRPNDLDYINYMNTDSVQQRMGTLEEQDLHIIKKMPQMKLSNFLFVNGGDSTFSNRSKDWGLDQSSYSNGAAYADLDNDGDLDLIVNNIADEAFVYESKFIDKDRKSDQPDPRYIRITLKGSDKNSHAIGAKVYLYYDGKVQLQECSPTRGFQSSVDYRLTFGTGASDKIDSLVVVWNDGSYQVLTQVKTNQAIVLDQGKANGTFDYAVLPKNNNAFIDKSGALALNYKHEENKLVEFNREALLPHMLSAEGPASAVGDVNNDGLEDIFLGGGKWSIARIYLQTTQGLFKEPTQALFKQDSTYEDVDAKFFDADSDGDQDLLVVSGGNEFTRESKYRQPRLYLNDGKGTFLRSVLLPVYATGSCVATHDIDNDGDLDLFLGARAIPWHYGIRPDSYILKNDGKGNFTDVSTAIAPELKGFGFVKDALWADMDGDKDKDLVVAAEWSAITILYNTNGKFQSSSTADTGLEKTNGWWNTVNAFDVDQDGDMDLIAGNLGLNSKLKASQDQPVRLYVSDFDKNDSTDQVLTHFFGGKEYPFNTRDEMTKQMPFLKKRYLSYRKFAEATVSDMFSQEALNNAEQYSAYTFESSIIENLGNGKFKQRALPKAAQFSTVNAVHVADVNKDGHADLVLAGNFYRVNIQLGRYDASYGLILTGDGKGNFQSLPAHQSGFSVNGEVRSLQSITVGGTNFILAIRNNDTVAVFSVGK
ncbi:MAG TPA: VCBS repeat-containing protein [Ohtaekwangia sp.]|nr:VCBS repeat-containing protein [Ohtaekwangia sp.]